nr:LAGLIDADG homing endonuclease [Lentinula edodes]
MNSGRNVYVYSLIPFLQIIPYWLLGFIEGEGTFGFKNLVPYFQIGQHARNLIVLDQIIGYIKSLSKGLNFSNFTTKIELSKTLNKSTDVYVIALSNIDALHEHDYLVPFLLSINFLRISRKSVDFIYCCLSIHLHKYGYYYFYFYIPEGISLVIVISKSIKTARYSNKPN